MNRHLHAHATTTPKIRAYIQPSAARHRGLARELEISVDTLLRWRKRTDEYDASPTTPHRLPTTLTPAQEVVTMVLRRTLLQPLSAEERQEPQKERKNNRKERELRRKEKALAEVAARLIRKRPGNYRVDATRSGQPCLGSAARRHRAFDGLIAPHAASCCITFS